jgi:hypothetical protein
MARTVKPGLPAIPSTVKDPGLRRLLQVMKQRLEIGEGNRRGKYDDKRWVTVSDLMDPDFFDGLAAAATASLESGDVQVGNGNDTINDILNNGLEFLDNVKLYLGTNKDAWWYFDGEDVRLTTKKSGESAGTLGSDSIAQGDHNGWVISTSDESSEEYADLRGDSSGRIGVYTGAATGGSGTRYQNYFYVGARDGYKTYIWRDSNEPVLSFMGANYAYIKTGTPSYAYDSNKMGITTIRFDLNKYSNQPANLNIYGNVDITPGNTQKDPQGLRVTHSTSGAVGTPLILRNGWYSDGTGVQIQFSYNTTANYDLGFLKLVKNDAVNNAADFVLELCSGSFGTEAEVLRIKGETGVGQFPVALPWGPTAAPYATLDYQLVNWKTLQDESSLWVHGNAVPDAGDRTELYEDYYIHETLGNIYEYTDSVAAPASVTAKSIILDCGGNWGDNIYTSLRSVDLYLDDELIELTDGDITCYQTTNYSSANLAKYVFITSTSKTGSMSSTSWVSKSYSNRLRNRLVCVFGAERTFDKIVINNGHGTNSVGGTETDRGVNYCTIWISDDAITSTTYQEEIANSTKLFEGSLVQHVSSNTEDPQTPWELSVDGFHTGNVCAEEYAVGQERDSYMGGAFDGELEVGDAGGSWYAYYDDDNAPDGWTGQNFGSGNEKTISRYLVRSKSHEYSPYTWTFEGSNSGAWLGEEEVLDTQTAVTWPSTAAKSWLAFDIDSPAEYQYYRINVTVNNGDPDNLIIQEIMMFESDGTAGGSGAGWTAIWTPDDRYYTETELDAGQLDSRYYTETELDAGQLDNRYYTETELDAGQLDNRYYTETELDAGQLDNRYYTETEINTKFTDGTIDHGNLSGLADDDHTQYTLREDWDQNGFPNRTDSEMSFTDGTRTFSIQPTDTSFDYYIAGVKYTTTGDTKVIDDTEGIHVLYYDGDTLTEAVNPAASAVDSVIRTKAICAILYWDSSAGTVIYFGEERHGMSMSPATHSLIHFTDGLKYISGLGPVDILADENGSSATHAQVGFDAGGVSDEDIYIAIDAVASTTGLPIYYMLVSGYWAKATNPGYIFNQGVGTLPYYNEDLGGGDWGLTEVANNDYCLYHVFATTEKDNPLISIMGQGDYATKAQARAGATTELLALITNEILFPEIKPIATFIFQCRDAYTVGARIVTTDDGGDYVDWRSDSISRATISTSDHGSLSGLADDDHPQYALVAGDTMTGALVFGDSVNLELGTDSDMLMYHTGAFGMIQNTTGGLYIESIGLLQLRAGGAVAALEIDTDADVKFYYDASVTGDLEVIGEMTLPTVETYIYFGADAQARIGNSSSGSPNYRWDPTKACYMGPTLDMLSGAVNASAIAFTIVDDAATSTSTAWRIANDTGAFIPELYNDIGDAVNRLGDVYIDDDKKIYFGNTASGDDYGYIYYKESDDIFRMFSAASGNCEEFRIGALHADGVLKLYSGGTSPTMYLNADNSVTIPMQPCFCAYLTSTASNLAKDTSHSLNSVNGYGWTEVYDQNNDHSGGVFTAPIAGKYLITYNVRVVGVDTAATSVYVTLVTSNRSYRSVLDPNFSADLSIYDFKGTFICDMDAADTAHLTIYQNGGSAAQIDVTGGGTTYTCWQGVLLC